ncbi:MAG: porin family protein [Nitrospirae bacterium]|nr:porin family protein [Nitrospirota bacterium]
MKRLIQSNFVAVVLVMLATLAVTSSICSAEEWSRKGKGEFFVFGQSMSSDAVTGLGIELEIDDTIVGGFGVGTNLTDHVNLNTELFFGSTDVTARGFGSSINGDTTLFGGDFNLDINILKGRITPLITGGIGFINFNGDYDGGSSFQETDFSYNVGGGLRWDITDHFLFKAMYKATWTTMEDSDESLRFDGANVNIGYMF